MPAATAVTAGAIASTGAEYDLRPTDRLETATPTPTPTSTLTQPNPATLARHLGLPELVRQRLDLGDAPGRANTSDKMMTLVASALAGGDCIDDADVLRTGGTACTACAARSRRQQGTLGTFLRSESVRATSVNSTG